MTAIAPYRSPVQPGRDGFRQLLHAEWTKFRTVRGWVIATVVAVLVTAGLGALLAKAASPQCEVQTSNGQQHAVACGQPTYTVGPGGGLVEDAFNWVRQPLAGNGTLTVRVASLAATVGAGPNGPHPAVVPWSKAGIIISGGTGQGSAYAAMMVTGGNGVRMQWNYTGDTPGLPGTVSTARPRWLRLARDGDTITGYDSANGAQWTQVGTVTLAGLPSTVQAGLFVTSPVYSTYSSSSIGSGSGSSRGTEATAALDHVSRTGRWPASTWTADYVGAEDNGVASRISGYREVDGQFTMTGSGDIAPLVAGALNDGPNITVRDYLLGLFIGLIAMAVVAALFMTSEYRRGLIRSTLAASPNRGRVLAAKAIVIGAVAFVVGLAAAAGAVVIGTMIAHSEGVDLYPEPWPTEVRIIVGMAALFAVAAVFTLAVATIVRRSAAAIIIVIVTLVIPFVLSAPPGIPADLNDWLLRVTPAAAFALQQPAPQYYQVAAHYTTGSGYFPLAPWAGFAVLCGWAAVALVLAAYLLRRRDA
jgi:hypothetical protein